MYGKLVAKDEKVWSEMLRIVKIFGLQPLSMPSGTPHHRLKPIYPMTSFPGGIFYITKLGPLRVLLYDSSANALTETSDSTFLDSYMFHAGVSGGLTAKWIVSAYRTFVYTAIALGGKGTRLVGQGVMFISLHAFWSKHMQAIVNCCERLESLINHLRVIYALCELSLAELRSLLLKGQHINIKTLS